MTSRKRDEAKVLALSAFNRMILVTRGRNDLADGLSEEIAKLVDAIIDAAIEEMGDVQTIADTIHQTIRASMDETTALFGCVDPRKPKTDD